MVATDISMGDLQAGEAIFRQQITEIVGVGTIDRVQLEYLQTEARSETEQAVYYAVLGISALPPPSTRDAALMLPAIETERERIVEKLKNGNVLASGRVTIDSLWLFGVPMRVVDIVLDGEAFAQLYMKPWLGVQLVIASATSFARGTNSGENTHYATGRDAFQDLRLRFLLAQRLESLQVGASDILVHSPMALLPFPIYQADAGVLETEVHVHSILYASLVEMYLLSDDTSSNSSFTAIADDFSEMEPQWELLTMEVNADAGDLFSPARSSSESPGSDSAAGSIASELTFEMFNISLAQLKRTKWSVLDFVRVVLARTISSRVSFGRIDFPPSSSQLSSLAIHNEGNGDGTPTGGGFTTESTFDPVNALQWTLSFKVEPEATGTGTLDSAVLEEQVFEIRSTVEMGLQNALGFTDTTSSSSSSSATFKDASDWVHGAVNDAVAEPFVDFTLTVQVEPLDASGSILESPNFFQLHHIRCALVLLLQQVAVSNDQVALLSSNAEDRPTVELDDSQHTWHRFLVFQFRATISDESQRRGVRSVVFSSRLASTISLYSGDTLALIEREIDLHADGSPAWPRNLPGVFVAAAKANNFSDGFVTSNTSLIRKQKTFVYEFDDPEADPASGILQDAADVCSPGGTASSGLCIRLRFTGTSPVALIFLRTVQSLYPVTSSSVSLPIANAARGSSPSSPAPWVLVDGQSPSGETLWTLFMDSSTSTAKAQSIRLTFAAVYNMQELSTTSPFTIDLELEQGNFETLPVVRRRQFGDLAVVATSDQPAPAFISAELPELTSNGVDVTRLNVAMNLQEPRLGGLYSASLLDEVAPSCSACTSFLSDCNSRLECRAFSACASVLLDADLTLASTLLQEEAISTSVDASWLLEYCWSPSDGTVWSSTMSQTLVSSFTCLWGNLCPLAHSATLSKQLVLDYSHGEQMLTFQLDAAGVAGLSFTLDAEEGESAFEFIKDFSGVTTDVSTELDATLMAMYRAALSNVATVESTLTTTEDAATGLVTATLTIKYLFLGRLPLPLVEITRSGNSDAAVVQVTVPKEKLTMRVVPT
jgi:hypothetical protein